MPSITLGPQKTFYFPPLPTHIMKSLQRGRIEQQYHDTLRRIIEHIHNLWIDVNPPLIIVQDCDREFQLLTKQIAAYHDI